MQGSPRAVAIRRARLSFPARAFDGLDRGKPWESGVGTGALSTGQTRFLERGHAEGAFSSARGQGAQNALLAQSQSDSSGVAHPDGGGIAYYPNTQP